MELVKTWKYQLVQEVRNLQNSPKLKNQTFLTKKFFFLIFLAPYPGLCDGVGVCPVTLTPFLDPLTIPTVVRPNSTNNRFHFEIVQFEKKLHSQLSGTTTLWGFNGEYPGPTFVVNRGESIYITWTNNLRDSQGNLRDTHYFHVAECIHGADYWGQLPRLSVHLHGGEVAAQFDGQPDLGFLPGESFTYFYPNEQPGTLLWYHDHAVGITRLNVMMGLAGAYIIRESWEEDLLPTGEYEIPLILQDRNLDANGKILYEDRFVLPGNPLKLGLVNGVVWPYLDVSRGKYRFRIVNGCPSRLLDIYFETEDGIRLDFLIIGADQGFLPNPVEVNSLTLMTGERYDIIVDFSSITPGSSVDLLNEGLVIVENIPLKNFLRFRVGNSIGYTANIPDQLIEPYLPDPVSVNAITHRAIIGGSTEGANCGPFKFFIDHLDWEDIREYPQMGDWYLWEWVNEDIADHPMHIHLVRFRIINRESFTVNASGEIIPSGIIFPPLDYEVNAWKDTVRATQGHITRILIPFPDENSALSGGYFPYHCHIADHEDYSMMRQFFFRHRESSCVIDGVCSLKEDCESCPEDCGKVPGNLCGNSLCEAGDGENCQNCPEDCAGSTSAGFCCSNENSDFFVDCSDSRCKGNPDWACRSEPVLAACCGDQFCYGQETSEGCPVDCEIPSNSQCRQATNIGSTYPAIITGTTVNGGQDIFKTTDICQDLTFVSRI
jgi:spore coat protein A